MITKTSAYFMNKIRRSFSEEQMNCIIKESLDQLRASLKDRKRYVRKVILRNGYAVEMNDCNSGDVIITLFLNNRTIYYDVGKKWITKSVYRSNPIMRLKSKSYPRS